MRSAAVIGRALAVYGGGSALFGSEDILAPPDRPHWHHHHMTVRAALEAGWSPPAADELAWHCVGADLYCSHPVWWVRGGPRRVRGARLGKVPLRALHFDSLRDTADIVEVRRRVEGGILVALHWAARTQDVLAARNALGTGLHALQDFYSHSTWIDVPERRCLTWTEHVARTTRPPEPLSTAGLGQDGSRGIPPHGDVRLTAGVLIRLPAMLLPVTASGRSGNGSRGTAGPRGGHGPGAGEPGPRGRVGPHGPVGLRCTGPAGINLDSRWQARTGARTRRLGDLDGDGAFETAVRLAVRESHQLLRAVGEHVEGRGELERFWSLVRDGPGLRWTEAFDDPHRLAYWFPAAGTYPPEGRRQSGGWFVRVLVTEPGTGPDPTVRPRALDRTVRLRASDRNGRTLAAWVCPLGRAGAVGPLPEGTVLVAVHGAVRPVEITLHAFTRHPEPTLVELAAGIRSRGPVRVPLRIG